MMHRKTRTLTRTACLAFAVILSGCTPPVEHRTELPAATDVITFVSEGTSFAPIIVLSGPAAVLWTWSDGTTSASTTPAVTFTGGMASRRHTLSVTPWSALRRINLGYDRGDGGTWDIEPNADQHVSLVENLALVAPYLVEWCSSYNRFTALDFSNFTHLETIECYLSASLTSVTLQNTPALRRACFEDCSLTALDLSECPALEDLRGAQNNYPTINFGTIGRQVWHICIRNNSQITDRDMFADMTQFPGISELFIWDDHQAGALVIPATSADRNVSILASGNEFTSLNLAGALHTPTHTATVDLSNNLITSVNLAGCTQINELNLNSNRLNAGTVDQILADLDGLGRSTDNTPASAPLFCDLRGNAAIDPAGSGAAHATNLASRGWTVRTQNQDFYPPPPANTGPATIAFVTNGENTVMRADFTGGATASWIWSDGSTTPAVSGQNVTRSGLGTGNHSHTLTIDNGAALTRFGAGGGGAQGNLVNISGLERCTYLTVLYVYNESGLAAIGRTNTTRLREYHLLGTALSALAMDQVFADAVASGANNGIIWAPNHGTSASDADRAVLVSPARGWTIN
jgi:hypothetical protein